MKKSISPKIVVILGPTATGKSGLAVKMAKRFGGEIISADSRQVYKGLDIGTGKVTDEEMQGVHHWMLDVISPKKSFSVADWKRLSESKIETISKRHKLPIICGGTGFYIQSIVDGLVLPEVPPNDALRKKLEKKSVNELFDTLYKLDRERAETIDKKNPVRLIRAIEIASALGKVPKVMSEGKFDALQIGLRLDDSSLRKKIRARLLKRMKIGMVEEAERLHKHGLTFERMRELGLEYRFLADLLEKKITKKEFLQKLETEIWHYAKRQMTWFKRDPRINWFDPKETKRIQKEIEKFLQ